MLSSDQESIVYALCGEHLGMMGPNVGGVELVWGGGALFWGSVGAIE